MIYEFDGIDAYTPTLAEDGEWSALANDGDFPFEQWEPVSDWEPSFEEIVEACGVAAARGWQN